MKQVTIACSKCGGCVAELAAFATGEGGGLLTDRPRLVRTKWFGTCERPMALEAAEAFVTRAERGELAALVREEIDLFSFFCGSCGRAYCEKCWEVDAPLFDDGFYDCTKGRCPNGHTKVLDD